MNATTTIKRPAQPLSINLPGVDHAKAKALATTHNLPVTAIVRLALRHGLPVVEKNLKGI